LKAAGRAGAPGELNCPLGKPGTDGTLSFFDNGTEERSVSPPFRWDLAEDPLIAIRPR